MNAPTSDLMPPMGFSLPLLGEDHPLRKSFQRTFLWSAMAAMLIHVVVAESRIAVSRYLGAAVAPSVSTTHPYSVEVIVPPLISTADIRPGASLATQVSPATAVIPDPVPDYEAKELTVASTDELAAQDKAFSWSDAGGEPLVASFADETPSPDEYVAVEEMPRLINAAEVQRATIDLYPEIAKSAGVEGTVNLKVYIGKTGEVERVLVLDGPPMLRDAAKQAVTLAKFTPALQQHHPVGIWVAWPLEFSLQS